MPNSVEIVLLGATGFAGSAVLRHAVSRSLPVHALVRDLARLAPGAVSVATGDLRNLRGGLFPQAPHVVIHLASKQIDTDGTGFRATNVDGTRRLMESLNSWCRGVVYGSSVSVYGQGAQCDADETWPVLPETELAGSRAEAERIIFAGAAERRIGAYCLRPRFVFGQGDRYTLPGLVRMIKSGVKPGPGSQRYTIFDVDDYASALVGVAMRLAEWPECLAVNAGYAQSISLDEIIEVLCTRLRLKAPRARVPVSVKATRMLRRVPVPALRTLATRLELFGLTHTFRVERLRELTGGAVTGRDPREVLACCAGAA